MLKEQDRTKLDGIVSQMTANGESDADIQFVVDDFKSKYTTQEEGIIGKVKDIYGGISETMKRGAIDIASGEALTVSSVLSGLEWLGLKGAGKYADKINAAVQKSAPLEQNFTDKLLSGVGSAAIFFVPGVGVARIASSVAKVSPTLAYLFGNSASTALEAMSEAGSVYEENTSAGKSESEASGAATKTFWANAILIGITNRYGVFNENVTGALKKAIVSAPIEGFQEGAQQIISNLNTGRSWYEGVAESSAIGAIIGGGMGAIEQTVGIPPRKDRELLEESAKDMVAQGKTPAEVKLELLKTLPPKVVDEVVNAVTPIESAQEQDNYISQQLASGLTPTEVALGLSEKMNPDYAIARVNEIVARGAKPIKNIAPTGEGAKKAGEELAALSDKVDEKILEKKTSEISDEILAAQDSLDAEVAGIKESIAKMEEKVASAPAKSQEKKDAKLALEKERTRLRKVEADFNDKAYNNTQAVRSFITGFIKDDLNIELTPEQEQNTLDEIATRLYDTTDRSNKSVRTITEEVVSEIVKPKKKEKKITKEEVAEQPELDIPAEVEEKANEDWTENYAEEFGNLAERASKLQKLIKEAPKKEIAELQKTLDSVIKRQGEMEDEFVEKWRKEAKPVGIQVGDVIDTKGGSNMKGDVTVISVEKQSVRFKDSEGMEYAGMNKATVKKLLKEGAWSLKDKIALPTTPEEAAQVYWDSVIEPEIKKGNTAVIGADDLKDFFGKDYDDKRHPIYSRAAYLLYERAIKEAPAGRVAYTGGGAGSGKTEVFVKQITGNVQKDDVPAILYDSNMANYDGVVKQIQLARKDGREVEIFGIIPNLDKAREFTLIREKETGRGVTAKTFARGHAGFPRIAKQLLDNGILAPEDLYLLDERGFRDIEDIKKDVRNNLYIEDRLALLNEVQYNEEELKQRYETQTNEVQGHKIPDSTKTPQENREAPDRASTKNRTDSQKITNEKDTTNRGSKTDAGGVSETLPVGGEESNDTGGATEVPRKHDKDRPSQRGGKLGERPRLTNEEIEKIVSSVVEISDTKEVELTGEITGEILDAANQYTPGGTAKEGRGILDEYYTEEQVVDMVKSLLDFPAKDLRIIEPSVGTGNFLYAIPEIGNHKVAALEINPTTAKIAKIFHPTARVFNKAFEELFIGERGERIAIEPTNQADLIIGNPPYGEHRGKYLGLGEEKGIKKYEDYFIKRGIDMLKEGGTLAMVVPSSYIDRKMDIKNATLVVAYRLPEGVFKGTKIGTDIVIFKKKLGASTRIGGYFTNNPTNILGEVKSHKNRFGKTETFVDGDIESAQALFDQHRNDSKAKGILKDLKIKPTKENIEEASEAIEEAGEGAKALIKEEEKAEKRIGKKTIEKKVVKKAIAKDDTIVPLAAQFAEVSESELELWRKTNAEGYVETPTDEDKKSLNFSMGKWYNDFNYSQGDIYERLRLLELEKKELGNKQYENQKAKLEAVLPVPERIDDIKLSPNHTFVSELKLGEMDGQPSTLRSKFLEWMGTLPRQAFGDSSQWEVRGYVNNEIVTGSDKDRNELTRNRRRVMADSLFSKFLKEELDDDTRHAVEDEYNKTYNFYHTPDYSKVPMFSDIHASFKGGKFTLNDAQREGIGRLVNRGVGILAHEVGFGKTISGVLAAHETMTRGWAKRPLIIAPNENVYTQWVKTIQDLVPNAKLNLLGNLGISYKGDLSALKIEDGTFTLVTYEGLKRLSFKDETYSKMAGKFSYIAEDLNAHKTKRGEAKAGEGVMGIAGGMKKGTRSDLFFEDLGFDHFTFDEIHNANHIVSKAKIEKGKASEFSRFSITPSDIGIKTWLATQYIQDKMNGRNVNLLSATPFTNHPLEYYSILSLVADKSLQKMRLGNVNDFFGSFMEANHEYEFKADGSYKPKTDVRRIKNYRQWRNLLGAYIDFKQDAPGIKRPNRLQQTYEIPQNTLTQEMNTKAQGIFEENDREAGKGAKVLRAINEFRKIAFSPYASKFSQEVTPEHYKEIIENSPKLATVMGIIAQNKKDKPEAGQIVYSEVGVDFFPLLKNYLVKEVGFKTNEVEIITGKTAKPTRITIQDNFNEGKIKILIGSEAISEGMNLQQNTTDMHLLSLPWNFTALRQVIGRAWRQGNDWSNVRINQYFIQDSIDIFLSQKLDNKQRRYEAAIASNANEVDVGDVSYNEMKSELIVDPEKRAKFEIEGQKEQLKADIMQSKAELAFATRKLEKINTLMESIKDDTDGLKKENEKSEPEEFWVNRYEKDIKNNKKELGEEIAKLKAKDIDVDTLLEKKEEGEKHITELETQEKAIEATYADRVKEIVATLPKRQFFSKDILDKFVAERAEHNKTFYNESQVPVEETIIVEKQVKEIKNAAGTKVVKKKTVTKAVKIKKETPKRAGTRDERVLKVLSDGNLNAAQKVGEILNVKQEGKEFKDTGERVTGSKKERAAINTVLENGDMAIIAEMIKTLGADAIAETLQKDEILEDAVKPDVEKDKADKVPAFVTGWKQKVLNSIGRTPTLVLRRGRYSNNQQVPEEAMLSFLTNYGEHLRTFVKELSEVKTYEQAVAFQDKFGYQFVDSIPVREDYAPSASIGVLGRTIASAIKDISTYRYVMGRIAETKKILEDGVQGEVWSGRMHYQSFASYGTGTTWYSKKEEAEIALKKNRGKNEEGVKEDLARLNDNYDYYLPKKKTKSDDVDLSHGNFKPLDRVVRSEPDISDDKINPETMTKEMGFKSVQLGNYMDDATAKEHIRYTIGAVKDMSKLLAIDFPKVMNKTGLSLALGARGGGKANAHYEPSHNIINLTKGRGDGSFFHEFVHFLDDQTNKSGYRKKWSGGKERYYRQDELDSSTLNLIQALTGDKIRKVKEFVPRDDAHVLDDKEHWVMRAREKGESLESVISRAKRESYPGRDMQNIADVYRQTVKEEVDVYREETEFYKNAIQLGGGKRDAYWARPHELLARAGQAYIEDKMIAAEMKNNYLTRATGESKAYPQGEERKIFNTYFNRVFAELSQRYPLEKQGELPSEPRFKLSDFLYERPEVSMTEAGKYLADVKKRLNLDFDVYFVESILSSRKTKFKNQIEAWGVTYDNSIALTKEMARHTAEHEVVHLTLTNLDKIPVFKREGITLHKVMSAKAAEMGISFTDETSDKIDEELATDFERYLNEKHEPKGIIRKFFALLKRALQRFAGAVIQTRSDIVKDYFDILDEGVALEEDYVNIENNGIIEAFIDEVGGSMLDFDKIENGKFKLKEEPDKRLQTLKGKFNDIVNKQTDLEQNAEAWKTDLLKEIVKKADTAKLVDETPERITGKFGEPGLIRYTTRTTPPPGTITERGEMEIESLGFANLEEAQQEINAYLQRKAQLISTRNRLRELRLQISQAKKDKKLNVSVLRDIERKLKMRKRFLEQKDYYVGMGVGRGKKEQMKMIHRRSRVIRDIQDQFAIGDKRAKDIIGGFGRQRIHLMSEQQFNDFTIEFYNRAEALGNQLSAQDEVKALVAENQFGKWENLQKAMGLPSVEKMTEEQAQSFVEVLSKYQFGDVFLTKRELETIHRTDWGEIETERELLGKIKSNMGFGREELKNLTARNVGDYTPWIRLARKHPFFNWLVGKRVEADIQATREYVSIENDTNPLAHAAISSRRKLMGIKERVIDIVIPTQPIIRGFLEIGDKATYAEKNKMTREELNYAYYIIGQNWNFYEYLKQFGTKEIENYMTHSRRNFFEALKDEGLMVAFREVFASQKEDAAGFKILDDETGNVLAFDKFLGNMLHRTGRLVPSENVTRVFLEYARAVSKKRAMDKFIPEAMIAVQAHKAVVGTTPKGLTKDPTLEKFVKEFLNNAKGRKIKFVTKQGSTSDIALRAGVAWVAIKYLGGNLASAIGNVMGDFTALFWELNIREQGRGIVRSIAHPLDSHAINKQFRYFTGRNPVVELFDARYALPMRLKNALMVFMALGAFQSNKFFLRAKMSDEEFKTGVIGDKRLVEIANALSRVKPNQFYVKSLAGNTTAGGATFQFGTWAIAITNTIFSDGQEVVKMFANRDFKKALTSREAQKLLKFGIMAGMLLWLTSLIDVDDDDYTLWGRTIRSIRNNLNTLVQALQFTTDPSNYLLIVKEINLWVTAAQQLFSGEEYKQDGVGYKIGDLKWLRTGERIITPNALRQFFPHVKESAKESQIEEAVKTGEFNAEEIAQAISPDWNDPEKMDAEAKERKIANVKMLYAVRKNYPDNPLVDIILNTLDNNEEKVEKMIEYNKQTGEVYSELKKLYRDSRICADPKKRTGCLVSGKLLKEYAIAERKQ